MFHNWFDCFSRHGGRFAIVVGLAMTAGCYQRPMSPELEYDRAQVEVLNEEMEDFDSEN